MSSWGYCHCSLFFKRLFSPFLRSGNFSYLHQQSIFFIYQKYKEQDFIHWSLKEVCSSAHVYVTSAVWILFEHTNGKLEGVNNRDGTIFLAVKRSGILFLDWNLFKMCPYFLIIYRMYIVVERCLVSVLASPHAPNGSVFTKVHGDRSRLC